VETPGLHQESKSDLLTEMIDFFLIGMDTQKNKFLNRNMVFGLVTTPAKHVLIYTHQPITRAENPAKIENKIHIYIQTVKISNREH